MPRLFSGIRERPRRAVLPSRRAPSLGGCGQSGRRTRRRPSRAARRPTSSARLVRLGLRRPVAVRTLLDDPTTRPLLAPPDGRRARARRSLSSADPTLALGSLVAAARRGRRPADLVAALLGSEALRDRLAAVLGQQRRAGRAPRPAPGALACAAGRSSWSRPAPSVLGPPGRAAELRRCRSARAPTRVGPAVADGVRRAAGRVPPAPAAAGRPRPRRAPGGRRRRGGARRSGRGDARGRPRDRAGRGRRHRGHGPARGRRAWASAAGASSTT